MDAGVSERKERDDVTAKAIGFRSRVASERTHKHTITLTHTHAHTRDFLHLPAATATTPIPPFLTLNGD